MKTSYTSISCGVYSLSNTGKITSEAIDQALMKHFGNGYNSAFIYINVRPGQKKALSVLKSKGFNIATECDDSILLVKVTSSKEKSKLRKTYRKLHPRAKYNYYW